MKNAEWMIKQGKNFSELTCHVNFVPGNATGKFEICLDSKIMGEIGISAISKNPVLVWLDMEHVEPILDDAEREYLSAVIKPFRDRVQYIAKSFADDARFYRINCYIFIHFNDGSDDMDFPLFNESKMYKGMAINRPYTLKELGL